MIRLRLLAVGKGDGELGGFEERMAKRLKPYVEFALVELPEGRGKIEQRKAEEERTILKAAAAGFILFDERGKGLSSVQWAEWLAQLPGNGARDFVIGGAAGVTDAVRQAAGSIWSLSPLTLPHQLVRALVVEQLYRACTIHAGHPYHRV